MDAMQYINLFLGQNLSKVLRSLLFISPFTYHEKAIYAHGLNYEPVYWDKCLIDIPVYHPGNLSMWRFVFDAEQNLN